MRRLGVAVSDGPVQGHDEGDDAVDLLGGLLLVGFDIAGRVGADVDVVDHPREHLVPTMLDPAFQCELHQLLARRAHVFEPLAERHNGEAQSIEVLRHLHRAPTVVGDLPNVVADAEFLDERFDGCVVDYVALSGMQQAFAFPLVVGHMVTVHPKLDVVFRDSEMRHHHIRLGLVPGWEHQHQRGDVGRGCEVQAGVTHPPLQGGKVDGSVAFVPQVHRHPPNRLLHPLVEAQLTEGVFFGGVDAGRVGGRPHLVDGHGDVQAWVGFTPHRLVQPIILRVSPIDHRVERQMGLLRVWLTSSLFRWGGAGKDIDHAEVVFRAVQS
ncbi:hypothetical protein CHUV2995_02789 [Corynebacterium diphtheriae subsp. lausannense]|nr:hypothetical protein CHUV2995_02789 [Corynebacterium diphtheriae subsp. lausannense]